MTCFYIHVYDVLFTQMTCLFESEDKEIGTIVMLTVCQNPRPLGVHLFINCRHWTFLSPPKWNMGHDPIEKQVQTGINRYLMALSWYLVLNFPRYEQRRSAGPSALRR